MAWNKKFPVNSKGEMISYPYIGFTMVDVYEFATTLRFDNYRRGRSSIVFYFTDNQNHEWPMFLADFTSLVKHMVNGQVSGTFTQVKRGSNYGIVKLR